MSEDHRIEAGAEFTSAPYLLDAAAAEAYLRAIESPRRRQPANIHNDQVAAQRAGFAAPIAAGEQSLAILAQLLADRFGMNFLRGGSFDIAFIKPVLFGDRLTAHCRIAGAGHKATTLEVWVTNQAGERVLAGTAAVAGDLPRGIPSDIQ
ncbi:MAG: MaoC family dehydratase [Candidatus Binatales bacterium]